MTSNLHVEDLADRYTDVWNEPDETTRRATIAQLWAEDGIELIEPDTYRGHDALHGRIRSAYEQFVANGDYVFVRAGRAATHHDAVTFGVHMVPAEGGPPVWAGLIFVLLDDTGKIRCDYQFAGRKARTHAAVAELLNRMTEARPERIAELFADTVDWQLDWPEHGHPAAPWIRPRNTRAEVAEHFRELSQVHDSEKQANIITRTLVDGADAVVLGTIAQTVRATGRAYTANFALHLSLDDSNAITRYHVYEDSLSVIQAFSDSAP